jgi:DNA-binding NarL/FixJ family response regulator
MFRLELLGASEPTLSPAGRQKLQAIREGLAQSFKGIRDISAGLCTPEATGRSLPALIKLAMARHEQRIGRSGELQLGAMPARIPHHIKISFFRLVQEGLQNAEKHAPGATFRIRAKAIGSRIVVEVQNDASAAQSRDSTPGGIGLLGLRELFAGAGGRLQLVRNLTVTVLRGECEIPGGAFHHQGSSGRRPSDLSGRGRWLSDVAAISKQQPLVRIVILSMAVEDAQVRTAMRCGAKAYLMKDVRRQQLSEALVSVHGGATYLAPSIGVSLLAYIEASSLQAADPKPVDPLARYLDAGAKSLVTSLVASPTRKSRWHFTWATKLSSIIRPTWWESSGSEPDRAGIEGEWMGAAGCLAILLCESAFD